MNLLGIEPITAISDLAQLVAALVACTCCVIATRGASPTMRRAWWLLAASTGSWAAGEATWSTYELVLRHDAPFPSLADLGFLLSVPLAVIGLCCFVESPARLYSRLLAVVEAAVIASGVLLVSWLVVLGAVYRNSSGDALERWISLAYPIGDCMILAVVLFATTRREVRRLGTISTLAGGFASIAVADSAFAVFSQSSSYSSGHIADLGWVVGFAVVAIAARRHRPGSAVYAASTRSRRLLLMVPFLPLATGGTIAVSTLAAGQRLDSTAVWIAVATVTLLCIHQFVVLIENDYLTSDLEGRVSARTRELAVRERQFAGLIENSSDLTFLVDPNGTITYSSRSARSVLGLDPESLVGSAFDGLLVIEDRQRTTTALVEADPHTRRPIRLEARFLSDGGERPAELTITNLQLEPALGGIVINGRDVTERRLLEDQLRYDALHDSLTGLANRRLLLEHLQLALDRRRDPAATTAALLMIDLDDFKAINDGFGHHAGDEYLMSVADRLRRCVRPGDTVARLGGDEFAVLLADVDRDAVAATAERMLEVLQLPITLADIDVVAPASAGVRIMVESDTPMLLLRDADIALYAAKSAGKGRVELFDPDMGEQATRRLTLKGDLRDAWRRGEITVLFQPIARIADRKLCGAEALVRWTHPLFGTVSPVEFVPLAEATGLIVSLGLEIMREACRRAVEWCATGNFSYISVNVSPVQLSADGFLASVDQVLASTGLTPDRLLLEVTEGVLLSSFESAVGVLEALRSRGIRIAIDDFGTGYSSLAYAQHLPVDLVKIDRAFTIEVMSPSTIIPAIIQIAEVLGAKVVAEGIETDEHAHRLLELSCELGQGYLYSPPVPATSFGRFVTEGVVVPSGAARGPSVSTVISLPAGKD